MSTEVEGRLVSFAQPLTQLDTIPGIDRRTAEVLIAELGVDMSYFPTEHHLASWAAICPGNNESAGKHRSGRTRRGNRWLRTALVEAAWAGIRVQGSALGARYRRLMRHRGHRKPWSRWRTPCSERSTTSWPRAPRTVSPALTIMTVATPSGFGGARSNCSNAKATG